MSSWFEINTLSGEHRKFVSLYHPLYDPSIKWLHHSQSMFEPMQLPSFLPVAANVAVVIGEAKHLVRLVLDVKQKPLVSSVVLPKMNAVDYLKLVSVFETPLCLFGPNLRQSCGIVCSFYFCEIIKEL